ERLRGFAPQGRWRTPTFPGALRCDRLTAPCVFDGPIDGECFRAYVAQQLIPVLKPGDIVILDNLGSHKSAGLRRMDQGRWRQALVSAPYSPDLNPIEQVFAKIKHRMRIAQSKTSGGPSAPCLQPSNPPSATTTSSLNRPISC